MTFKRTIRCRYCYGHGHNITKCPQKAARIEELRALHGSEHYAVQQYDAKANARKQGGKCTFCEERGHNRLSCNLRKDRLEKFVALNAEYISFLSAKIAREGAGVGALVQHKHYYAENPSIYIVKNYDFTGTVVTDRNTVNPFVCSPLTPSNGEGYYAALNGGGNRIHLPEGNLNPSTQTENELFHQSKAYCWEMESVITRQDRFEILTPSHVMNEVPLKVIRSSCQAAMANRNRWNPVRNLANFDASYEKYSALVRDAMNNITRMPSLQEQSAS